MTQAMGATRAQYWGDLHESSHWTAGTANESCMDLANNAVGRSIGAAAPTASLDSLKTLIKSSTALTSAPFSC